MSNLIPSIRKNRAISTAKISCDERHGMIAMAAYYLAEKRCFAGRYQLHDWLEAERVIHRIYGVEPNNSY